MQLQFPLLLFSALTLSSAANANPSLCFGQSVDCFNAEAQKWVTFPNANTCEDFYDGGWKTRAYCK